MSATRSRCRKLAVGLIGAALLAACSDQVMNPIVPASTSDLASRVQPGKPLFFTSAPPGVVSEELYLSDELATTPSGSTPEYNGGTLNYVALDDGTGRANLELLVTLKGACAEGLPAGVTCDVAFDKPHISATPDGSRVYVVNRFRPDRPQDRPIYSGTPVGYFDVHTSTFVFQGMIPGLPQEGTVLAADAPDGAFYVANQQTSHLYRINAATLSVEADWPIVKSTGGPLDLAGADIAFDAAGTLYLWTNTDVNGGADRGLYSLTIPGNPGDNSVATRRGGTSTSYLTGLAIRNAGNGDLLGSSESDDVIYEIDPTTGALGTSFAMYLAGSPYDHRYGDMTVGRLVREQPMIKLVKLTNGTDNNSPTGPLVPVGSTVTWTYTVTNPGNVPLSNIVVTDDQGVVPVYQSGDANSNGLLDLTETWTYSASDTAVAGQYGNIGMASGTWKGVTVTSMDPDHYYGKTPPPPPPPDCDKDWGSKYSSGLMGSYGSKGSDDCDHDGDHCDKDSGSHYSSGFMGTAGSKGSKGSDDCDHDGDHCDKDSGSHYSSGFMGTAGSKGSKGSCSDDSKDSHDGKDSHGSSGSNKGSSNSKGYGGSGGSKGW